MGQPRRKSHKVDCSRIAVAKRRKQAIELRLQHLSLRAIAKQMNLGGPESARKLIDGGIRDIEAPSVEELRKQLTENAHLRQNVLSSAAAKGDLEALREHRREDEHIAKLHGVYAKSEVELTGSVTLNKQDARDDILSALARIASDGAAASSN